MKEHFTNAQSDPLFEAATKILTGQIDEAKTKLGSKVLITKGPKDVKGKTGYVGEINLGLHKGAETYVIDVEDGGHITLKRDSFKLVESLDEASNDLKKEKLRSKIAGLKDSLAKLNQTMDDPDYVNKNDPQSRLFHQRRLKEIPREISKFSKQLYNLIDLELRLPPPPAKGDKSKVDKALSKVDYTKIYSQYEKEFAKILATGKDLKTKDEWSDLVVDLGYLVNDIEDVNAEAKWAKHSAASKLANLLAKAEAEYKRIKKNNSYKAFEDTKSELDEEAKFDVKKLVDDAAALRRKNPQLRHGQSIMITLHKMNKDLYDMAVEKADAFYKDSNVEKLLRLLSDELDEETTEQYGSGIFRRQNRSERRKLYYALNTLKELVNKRNDIMLKTFKEKPDLENKESFEKIHSHIKEINKIWEKIGDGDFIDLHLM